MNKTAIELEFFKIKVLDKDAKLLNEETGEVKMGIPLGSTIGILTPRGGGKSTLVKSLCFVFQRVPRFIVVSLSEDGDHFYSSFVPKNFIYSSWDESLLARIFETQDFFIKKYGNKSPKSQMVLVFDDCLAEKKIWKNDLLIKLFLNGRHKNITFIFTLQSHNGHTIPSEVRDNIDFLFILALPSVSVKEKVYKEYTDTFENKNQFRLYLDYCTKNFGSLVLNKKLKSDKLKHKVFYYKASLNLPEFKVGESSLWLISNTFREKKPKKIEKYGGTTFKLF